MAETSLCSGIWLFGAECATHGSWKTVWQGQVAAKEILETCTSASKRTIVSIVGLHHLASTTFSSNAFIEQIFHRDLLSFRNSSTTLFICCSIWTKHPAVNTLLNLNKALSRNAASIRLGRRSAIVGDQLCPLRWIDERIESKSQRANQGTQSP